MFSRSELKLNEIHFERSASNMIVPPLKMPDELNFFRIGYDDSNHGKYDAPRSSQKDHDDYVRGHNAATDGRKESERELSKWK